MQRKTRELLSRNACRIDSGVSARGRSVRARPERPSRRVGAVPFRAAVGRIHDFVPDSSAFRDGRTRSRFPHPFSRPRTGAPAEKVRGCHPQRSTRRRCRPVVRAWRSPVARGRPCGPLVDIMSIIGKKGRFIAAGQRPGFGLPIYPQPVCVDLVRRARPALVRRVSDSVRRPRSVAARCVHRLLNNIHAAGCAAPDR